MNEPLLEEDLRDDNDESFETEFTNQLKNPVELQRMEHAIRLVYQNLNIDDDMDKYSQIEFYSNLSQIVKSYAKQILKGFTGRFVNSTFTVMRMTNVVLIRNLYKLCVKHFSNKEEVRQEPDWQ